jgi:hypothetical protein
LIWQWKINNMTSSVQSVSKWDWTIGALVTIKSSHKWTQFIGCIEIKVLGPMIYEK